MTHLKLMLMKQGLGTSAKTVTFKDKTVQWASSHSEWPGMKISRETQALFHEYKRSSNKEWLFMTLLR